jgi:hypothetical protein
MEAAVHCPNHREVVDGLRPCGRCGQSFCHDCLVEISGDVRCAPCKSERLLDVLSGVDSTQQATGPTVRVYSPVAVAVYGLLLAFPCSLLLAVENWIALGQKKRIKGHLLGFGALAVILAVVVVRMPQTARLFAFTANVMAFAYFKQRLKADLAEYSALNPSADIVIKPWYRGLGSAVGGMVAFLVIIYLVSIPFGLPEE